MEKILSRGVVGRSNVGDGWKSLWEPHFPNDGTTLRGGCGGVCITNAAAIVACGLHEYQQSNPQILNMTCCSNDSMRS